MEFTRKLVIGAAWATGIGALGYLLSQEAFFLVLLAFGGATLSLGIPIYGELSKKHRQVSETIKQNDLVDEIHAFASGPLARIGHLKDNAGIVGVVEETNTLVILMSGYQPKTISGCEILGAEVVCDTDVIFTTKGSAVGIASGGFGISRGHQQTTGRSVVREVFLCLELDRMGDPIVKLPFHGVQSAETWFAVIKALVHRAQRSDPSTLVRSISE